MKTCNQAEFGVSIAVFFFHSKQHVIEITLYLIFKLISGTTGQDEKMVSICDA